MKLAYRIGGSISMVVVMLAASSPRAGAATAFDIVITGPGMRHPVTLRWTQIATSVPRNFFDPTTEPVGSLGTAYDLRVSEFIPSTPPRPLRVVHWTYYPHRDVVRFNEARDARNRWAQPVPGFRLLLDHAVASGKGRGVLVPSLAAGIISLTVLGLLLVLGRKRRARARVSHASAQHDLTVT